jgi:hypothetical protein
LQRIALAAFLTKGVAMLNRLCQNRNGVMKLSTELLSRSEAANRARVKVCSLDRYIKAGTGPVVTKIGGRIFVMTSDLEAWINSRRMPNLVD